MSALHKDGEPKVQTCVSNEVLALLSPAERRVYSQLQEIASDSGFKAPSSVLSTGLDDFDDWQILLGVVTMTRLGLANILAIVTGLQGSLWRARATCGVLRRLGSDIPVVVGSDLGSRPLDEVRALSLADPEFLAPEYAVFTDRRNYLGSIPTACDLHGLASFTDLADMLRDPNNAAGIRRVYAMSGVLQKNEATDSTYSDLTLTPTGLLQPNWTATNNNFSPGSTRTLFTEAQQRGGLTVLTRQAAYASKLPVTEVKQLEVYGTHDPISKFVYDLAVRLLQQLWGGVVDGRIRDRQWFYDLFMEGQAPAEFASMSDRGLKFHRIIDHVRYFACYDLMTVLASIPLLKDELFKPVNSPDGSKSVIGLSAAENGINPHSSINLPALLALLTKLPILEKLEREGKI